MGQGGPVTGGAVGSITINTAQLAAARAAVNAFATGVNTSLTGINRGTNAAQQSISGLNASIGQLGVSFGVLQLGRFVIESDALATSYSRQSVAARGLAGSQSRLNDLLQTYDKATGGIADKASALQSVTKLMAVGFADSAQELEKFATAIRGISIAMGTTQDYTTQNLILELFSQRGMRLDQLGLDYALVRARADELAAADASLTAQQAYQNAVLEQAIERFGDLATSAEGAATGAENAAKAFKDVRLAWGQLTGGPVGFAGNAISEWLQQATKDAEALRLVVVDLGQALGVLPRSWQSSWNPAAAPRRSVNFGNRTTAGPASTPVIEGEAEAKLDWARGVKDINDRLHDDIISAETDYGRQRANTISEYQKGVLREERDFGRQRMRQELEQLDAIADVWKDGARRDAKAAADLARSQSQARADADERIADARKDTAKRLADLDEDFKKDQERREEDYRDDMLSAAGTLNAVRLLELRKDRSRELKDAQDAHKEQRADLQEQLAERIADEEKSLEKSNRQANEAAQRQLQEARENDRLRVEEMKADFAKRKEQEDADRAIRKSDAAQDHADALTAMDQAHGLRLNQIRTQALREREQHQLDHEAEMVRLKAADAAMKERVLAREKVLMDSYDRYWDHVQKRMSETDPRALIGGPVKAYATGGPVTATGLALVHRGEYVIPASAMGGGSGGRSVSIGTLSPNMYFGDIGNYTPEQIKAIAVEGMTEALGSV